MVRASSPPKCLHLDCVGKRRTGTRHGNDYRNVREKQGNVVYRQRVLQIVTTCCFTSVLRARPPENCKYQFPARSHTFPMEKLSFPREKGGNRALGLSQHLKGTSPNALTESQQLANKKCNHK